ncbi:MAG: hypothetical protein MI974_33545 [Chitinophagales bacterium]|nr:hypothetical protein [Chitinophagales bacterium]
MATHNNYQLLINKLDQFIRKFYINKLIRGTLYSIGLILFLFLMVSLLEYYYYFGTDVRKLMFFSFIGVSLIALTAWVFIPLSKYFRLGSVISHEQAAQIIGEHFTDVKDKLLNVLQLKKQSDHSENRELILASINQKSDEIKVVPFRNAIDLSKNRKYLRYALPPMMLLVLILFINANLITDSTTRLINNNTDFEKPAPFSFVLGENDPSVVQFEDYPLTVKVEGEQLPNEVFINIDNAQYRLAKEAANEFSYTFNNVQKALDFNLYSSGVSSKEYTLDVLMKPNIAAFDVKLDYPAYTQRKDEELSNIGDLTVPTGTNVDWVLDAENTDAIKVQFSGEEAVAIKRFSDDLFTFKKRMMSDAGYKLYVSNEALPNADSISYSISVIPDLYPAIKAEKFQDSLDRKLMYFVGEASDDYGLLNLNFNYRIKDVEGKQGKLNTTSINKPSGKTIRYDHVFDLNELALKPGEEVTYYFEIFDNDAVNGSKSARTNLMVFAMPTVDEFKAIEEQNDEEIKEDLKKALEESRKIQEEMKKMREKLLQEKEMDWQTRKELEKMLERQKELEKKIEEANKNFKENQENRKEFSEQDEQIMEKQEKLQEMMEEVMSDEMKELMKQIEELLQEMNKEEALEKMEEMELSDEQLEMELDRMLEMFKQLELEQEMQETISELEKLAEEQKELSEKTEEGKESEEDLKKEQEEIDEKFQDIKEKMDKMQEKNKELEQPKEMPDRSEQMEDIQQDIDQSQEQLDQQQNKKASESQKDASEKMQDMAQAMQMMMESGEMEQMEEDMKALRQLLENLVGLSFDQEDLIDEFGTTQTNTPRYVELVQGQFKLKDDFRLVEDSLQALSKRVFQIESFVTEKVGEIKNNIRESLDELEERRKPQAANHQQRTMKNVNDLALMLSEVMNQMQQQMSGMMAGSQMCNKPGGKGSSGKVPKDKISQGQQSLNQQMKQLKQKMQQGKGSPSAKEFAEMAARQAALRKALKEKQKEMQEKGQGGSKQIQDIMDGMDKIEEDLVNKRLSNEMLLRQQDILTRLLEHEKAERQREYDQQRKAEQASQYERKMPPSLEEYIKKREAEIDMYKSVSPSLKPYYKFLVEEYFKSLKSE